MMTNRRPACCLPVTGSVTRIPCTSMLLGPALMKAGHEKLENTRLPTVMLWPASLSSGVASPGTDTRPNAAAIRTAVTPRLTPRALYLSKAICKSSRGEDRPRPQDDHARFAQEACHEDVKKMSNHSRSVPWLGPFRRWVCRSVDDAHSPVVDVTSVRFLLSAS